MKAFTCALAAMLFYCSSQSWAQSNVWESGISDDGTYLFAVTAHQNMTGVAQFCYFDSENCIYALIQDAVCDEGAEYPALINSDKGASHHTLICGGRTAAGLRNRYLYMFDNFDDIDIVIRGGTTMGIAIPMESGRFQVVRFSLSGSIKAIDTMRSTYQRMTSTPRSHSKSSPLPIRESI